MSGKLVSRVYEEADLGHPLQSVLVAMADHAHDDGTKVFPSADRIAWKTGYSTRQVRRIIAKLKEMGVLRVVKSGRKGVNTEYKIILSKAPKKPSFQAWKGGQNDTESDESEDNMTLDGIDESSVTGDRDSVTSGCHPNRHTTVIGEEGDKSPSSKLVNQVAYGIFAEWCREANIDPNTVANRATEMRHATALAKTGMTAEHVHNYFEWLSKLEWRKGPVTLSLMVNQANAYRVALAEKANKPVNKRNEFVPG